MNKKKGFIESKMSRVTVAFSATTKLLFNDLVLFCLVGERGEVLCLVLEKRRWLL
jgi:hypothetical protein